MPIYEYVCTACDHRTDILHGINDPSPHFCPSCGREGTMRKLFAPPAIHYKGSGWAKKDRGGSTSRSKSTTSPEPTPDSASASTGPADGSSGPSATPSPGSGD